MCMSLHVELIGWYLAHVCMSLELTYGYDIDT
jgi:hypothetical protein